MTSGQRRLRDWKEIAAFFGRDERTVRRWERQRGLPVHRVSGGARNLVFAYTDELERWLRNGGGSIAREHSDVDATGTRSSEISAKGFGPDVPSLPVSTPDEVSTRPATAGRRRVHLVVLVACVVAVLAVAGAVAALVRPGPAIWVTHKPEQRVQALYLDAVYALGTRQAEGIVRAMRLLTEATTLDPAYADAYAKLAEAYNVISQYTLMPADEAYPRAVAAANRAISIEAGHSGAHAALAFATFYWLKDFDTSRALFEKAVALDPHDAQTRHWFALTLMVTGETAVPLEQITLAQKLNPESRAILANKALILFHAGQGDEALSILQHLAASEPNLRSPHEYLATIYLDRGRFTDFLREYEAAARISRNDARLAIADAAGRGLGEAGGEGMLAAMLEEQIRQFRMNLEPAYKVAVTAAMLGNRESAVGYLQESMRRGEPDMLGVRIDPAFKELRTDPGFRDIVERMGFRPAETSGS